MCGDMWSINVQLSELELGDVSIMPDKFCHSDGLFLCIPRLIVALSLINCSKMFYEHTQGNQVDPVPIS